MRKIVITGGFVFVLVLCWSMTHAQEGFYVIAGKKPNFAPVEKTGQTQCYDQSGTAIGCSGTGQDGEHQEGVASPAPRFTDNLDGTVTDLLTGLIWLKNGNCSTFYLMDGTGQNNRTWENALTAANLLANGYCGLTDGSAAGDWRLPNYKELTSLLDLGQDSPALPADNLIQVQYDFYWSSTTVMGATNNAWAVNLDTGWVPNRAKVQVWYVLPVRGGP